MTVEGVRATPSDDSSEGWEGVDCALYFKGDTLESAGRVDLVQVKYSSAHPDKAWTLARLVSNKAQKGNNSVLRRMGAAFEAARNKRGGSSAGIRVQLISNQPIHADVRALFASIRKGSLSGAKAENAMRAKKATGLTVAGFRRFAQAAEWQQEGSRFSLEENILRTISGWTEGDARPILNDLLRYMRRLMMPEGSRDWIRKESLLAHFGFSAMSALLPCKPQLTPVPNLIHRGTSSKTVDAMRDGKKHVCLYGVAGCGKTTALQEIETLLPAGSQMLAFDCYGGGRYLDADAYRHRDKDAFLQLSNELAAKLRVPLLLTRADGTDYARAFSNRLRSASEVLKVSAPDALLVIAVDAADNSITAAQRVVPPEGSFVQKFVTFEQLPDNVRLLVSARSGRLDILRLPGYFHQLEVTGFTRNETEQHVRSVWPGAPDSWIDEFDHYSNGNPRVQRYALALNKDDPKEALAALLPGGKVLDDVFRSQLENARTKLGKKEPLDSFSAALSVLPHPAPVSDLAAVAGLTEAEVADICADLAPGIRFTDTGVGFADEDFEDFIRTSSVALAPMMRGRMADRFLQRHKTDAYAATHLAIALHAAGRGKEILDLIEEEPQPDAILDPILRREAGLRRLQVAMQVSTENDDESSMLRTILVGAEAMHSAQAVMDLIVKNPDLAAMFMRDSAARTLLLDAKQISHHGRLLFYMFLDDARAGDEISARATYRQLQAWFRKRDEEIDRQAQSNATPQDWLITADDIAAQAEAILLLGGPKEAIAALKSWKPRQAVFKAVASMVERLICSGRGDLVESLLAEAEVKDPWSLFLLVPLALSGRDVDLDRLERGLRQIHRRGWIRLDEVDRSWNENLPSVWLDTVLTASEVLVARGKDPKTLRPLLEIFADDAYRQIDTFYAHRTTLIDLQLRARALLVRMAGRVFTIDEFLITPPVTPKQGQTGESWGDSQRRQRTKYFIGPLIPLYNARARLILGEQSAAQRTQLLEEAGQKLDEYHFTQMHEAFEMRRKAAAAAAQLRCVPDIPAPELLGRVLNIFGERPGHFGADELSVLPAFVSDKSLHGRMLQVVSKRMSDIVNARTVASEKIGAVLDLCRFVTDISHDEAAAQFSGAHKMTEEIDVDAIHHLRAAAAMALRSSPALDAEQRRQSCQRLHSITTDAAVRLSDHEGFPWDAILEALVRLDLSVALAAVARWEDTAMKGLESTVSTLLAVGLETNQISPKLAVALLPLLGHTTTDILRSVAAGCRQMPFDERIAVVEKLAWDILFRFGPARDPQIVEALVQSVGSQHAGVPWVAKLEETASFLKRENGRQASPRKSDGSERFDLPKQPAIQFPPGSRFVSPDEIAGTVKRAVDAARAANGFVSLTDVFETMRLAVPVADRVAHLEALAAVRSDHISSSIVAEAIDTALKDTPWKEMASIREWCRSRLPGVIVDRLPGFAHGFGFGGQPPLPPLLRLLADAGTDIPRLLAQAIGAHVDELNAGVVYELVRLMVAYMSLAQCATAFTRHLERVQKRIPADVLDEIPITDVPTDMPVAMARLLRALMSDCDIRRRWRAAHAVRRLAAFGLAEPFEAWVNLYDVTSEVAFRAANEPLYWLAARLWSVIVLDRVAHQTPQALTKYFSKIVDIATDESLPHVVIRAFAKDAALHLLNSGHGKLTAARRKQLNAVNVSSLPRASKDWESRRERSKRTKERERKFDFDHMDTVRYWYEPAINVFADVSQEEFLDVAEHWIVDKWQTPVADSRWDLQPRKYRFDERNWTESSNSHGSEPILERFTTYLERHAMFCAVGELMKTKSLEKATDYGDDRFASWLKGEGLSAPPEWLADLRCPKPLERQFWFEPENVAKWLDGPSENEILTEVLAEQDQGMITVQSWHQTSSSKGLSWVHLDSALVEPATAGSLMRALQSSGDPHDYKLPDEGEDFEIKQPSYRLLGWLDDVSVQSGIDSMDTFRQTVNGIGLRPGPSISTGLVERFSSDGKVTWHAANQSTAFRYLMWSDKRQDERSDRHRYKLESEGARLSVSTKMLRTWMTKTGMDVIVSIKVLREEGGGEYEGSSKEKKNSRSAKVILLRQDGSIETSDGHIGTWQTPRR